MKNLITKEHKHMLWKDELFGAKGSTNHTFLLLKYAEVYRYSKDTLRLYIWSSQKLSQLRRKGVIFNEQPSADDFYIADTKVSNLPLLISLGAFKRRPNINGKWLKNKEKILAHKILPYNPVKFEEKT